MNILILGGTGAMGMHLVDILSDDPRNEISVTTRRNRDPQRQNVSYITGDAKDGVFLDAALSRKKWDAVVDFMVYGTEEFSRRADLLLSSCGQYVFLSSARVYADSKKPITEDSPRLLDVCKDDAYLATDEYALAKARQEDILLGSGKRNWTIVRPYITYGESRLQLGVLEKETWLCVALRCGALVFSEDIARHTTTLTYGRDVARGIAALIGNGNALGEKFHIAGSRPITWQKVFEIYSRTLKNRGVAFEEFMKERTYRLDGGIGKYQVLYDRYYDRVFDSAKIARFMDIDSFVPPEEGLVRCLESFLDNPVFDHTDMGGGEDSARDEKDAPVFGGERHEAETEIPAHKNASVLRRIYRKSRRAAQGISRRFKKLVPVTIPVLHSELLRGRTALITGCTSGIGKSIAEAFLNSGANVILTGRNVRKLADLRKEFIQKMGAPFEAKMDTAMLDVAKVPEIEKQFAGILSASKFEAIDIFVNNAGINFGGQFGHTESGDFEAVMRTNLEGTYFASQVFARYMRDRRIQGNILNIASSSSNRPAVSAYTCSKWALKGLTQGMAKSLLPYGIVVNALAPGPTATPMLIKDGYGGIELGASPAGRYAVPEEIANMAVVLVSGMGRMVVGDTVMMTGGAGVITFDDMRYEF